MHNYIFIDGGVTGDYNSNYGKTASGVNANVTSNGTKVSSSSYSDCYYYENVLIQGDFRATVTIVDVYKYGGLAFLNSSQSRQWFVECNIDGGKGWGWNSSDSNIFDSSMSMPRKLTLERIGTTLKIYMDDVLKRTETVNTVDGYLGWKTHSHSSRSITFKDFTIEQL